jgi:transcriptional regulator with XRE-family HTH domain
MEVAERIVELINLLNINKKTFALSINVSPGNISDWLSKNRKANPSMDAIIRISEKYDVNLNWLLTGKGEMFLSDNKEPQEKRVDNNELINLRRRYDQLEKVCNDLKKSIEESEKECSILSNKNQELNQELFTRLRELLECKDLIIKLQKNNC